MALETVRLVAAQAKGETSMAVVRTCGVPKMVEAWAVRKAITTPEPGPTSRTKGVPGWGEEEEEEKRDERKAVSEGEERVSSRRKESSAGS